MNKENYLKHELYQLIKSDDSIFDFLQNSALDGLWYWDLEKTENTWMNPKFWLTLGYDPNDMPHSTEMWQGIVQKEDLELTYQNLQRHLENTNYPYDQEVRCRNKNGNTVWIRCRGMAIKDDSGKPVRMLGAHSNITDLKEKDKQQEETIQHLQAILNSTGDLVFVLNEDLIVKEYYATGKDKLLIEPEQFLNKSFKEIKFPIDAKNDIIRCIQDTFAQGIRQQVEYSLHLPNGREYFQLITNQLKKEGEKAEVICVIQEITARKNAELQTRESKEKLQKLTDNVPGAIYQFEMDPNGNISFPFLSKNITLLHDADPVEIQHNPALAYSEIHPDDVEYIQNAIDESARQLTEFKVEYRATRRNGEIQWHRGIAKPEKKPDGTIVWYGIFQDITEYKNLLDKIKDSKEAIENLSAEKTNILESISDGFFVLNQDFGVEFFNDAAERLLGKKKEEVLNKSIFDNFPEAKGSIFEEKYRYALDNQAKINFEVYFEPYQEWYKVHVYPYNNKISVYFQVNTKQKQTEEELINAKNVAEKASKAKSEFVANMSHEIRTPLNGVIGFTDLLLKTNLNSIQKQYMQTVHHSANALLETINDILDFSKIEAGKLELYLEKTDLYDLSIQIIDLIKYQAHKKGLEVLLNIDPEVPRFIIADGVRLRQILVNLLGNAVKFTEKGEIELKIEVAEKMKGDFVQLNFSVRDTGVGIQENKLKQIFNAFAQEDASTTRKFGGTGLGLTISNKLLAFMKSQLNLKSSFGQGSIFSFGINFQVAESDAVSVADLSVLKTIKKILVVDDNDNNRNILTGMLATENISCQAVNNGMKALELLSNGAKFDVIFMDYHMPFLNGLETIKKIREELQLEADEQPVILFHSSSDDENIHKQATNLNINRLMVKPINLQQLRQLLIEVKSNANQSPKPADSERESTSKNLKGIKVLIAEDNEINLMLAKSIFQRMHSEIQLYEAEDGERAFQLAKKVNPDIIFMDIQMPRMNGYDATRKIRKEISNKEIVIVALTAGTVKGEEEQCFEAGMNDYITKPVIEETIIRIMDQWINPSKDKFFTAGPKLQLPELKKQFTGNEAMYDQILQKTDKYLNNVVEVMKSHLHKNDFMSLHRVAHTLKGTAASVKLDQLSLKASEILADKSNDLSTLNGLIAQVEQEIKLNMHKAKDE